MLLIVLCTSVSFCKHGFKVYFKTQRAYENTIAPFFDIVGNFSASAASIAVCDRNDNLDEQIQPIFNKPH